MSKWKLEQWCVYASHGVRYLPDRKQVYKELRQHVDDRFESFTARGETEEEAVEHTLHAMGDAREVSKLMEQIHRPFWGYLYSVTKWVAILMACACLLYLPRGLKNWDSMYYGEHDRNWIDKYVDKGEPILYTEPGNSIACDGYTVTLSKVIMWRSEWTYSTDRRLRVQLQMTNPSPWGKTSDIDDWISAEDSDGNYYYSYGEYLNYYYLDKSLRREITGMSYRKDLFTSLCEMECYIPEETEWIDLHYNRDGRNWKLRVDLTGGDGQ